jgi:molybdate transport system substrate-binding protein
MFKMKKSRLLIVLVVVLALMMAMLGACGSSDDSKSDDDATKAPELSGKVVIAAAASLENAFVEELIPAFKAANPGVEFEGSYDSSGKLQEQIEGGLAPSIFFSAATKQMTALVDGGFIDASAVVNLLENQVVLITSTQGTTSVTGFDNITDAKSIAIGDPASVPAGQYAQEVLTSLGVWDKVEKTASLGTNVTEVLNAVAEGSAEVGIVYATDAYSLSDKVKIIATAPADSMKAPVIYPVAKLKSIPEADKAAVDAFVEFLKGSEAKAIFEKLGFKVV